MFATCDPMLLFRSIALGLLGAIVWLLATHTSTTKIEHERELVAIGSGTQKPGPAPTIIDVAPGLSATQIAQLVKLGPNERVTSVDDRAVTGNLDAGTVMTAEGRHFVDLTVSGAAARSERRVLVLIH